MEAVLTPVILAVAMVGTIVLDVIAVTHHTAAGLLIAFCESTSSIQFTGWY